jgi:glycosyltransferase involved in cell wall biosynthesis
VLRCLSVGRFCEKKGFEYLLQACRILKDRSRRFRCQIVRYGELQTKLEVMINDLGLGECVSLVEKMTQDGLATVYPEASIFVLPCLVTENGDRDGIPNVLIEAIASRTAVVSTAVSGISELVEHNFVIFISDGKIVESGTHHDPLDLHGEYAALFRRQGLWNPQEELRVVHG